MRIYSGRNASAEFQPRLKLIKNARLYWCTLVVEWKGKGIPRWADDSTVITLLKERLLKSLSVDNEKVILFIFPTGDILVAGESLPNAAYQRLKVTLEAFISELETTLNAPCTSYDLSVDWDAFMGICREIYNRLNKFDEPEFNDTTSLIQRLTQELEAASTRIKSRTNKTSSLNLLFVEDEPTIRQLLNGLMGDSGHTLTFAANGEEAIQAYCNKPPHIVFLDINLPDISGLQVLEIISKIDPKAYAVMLTSGAGSEQVKSAVQQGVKGYIIKPFSRQKLTDCIQRYLDS